MVNYRIGIIVIGFVVLAGSVVGVSQFYNPTDQDVEQDSTEVIGYWDGTYHDETIEGTREATVPADKREKVVDRAIARTEIIRGETFNEDIEVRFMTREEYEEDNPFQVSEEQYSAWNDTLWSAQLIIPTPANYSSVRNDTFNNNVLAYYLIGQNELVLVTEEVSEDGNYVYIDEESLVHELTHAMQDQRFGLDNEALQSEFTPERQGILTLIEGEAIVVQNQFNQRCENTQWNCVEYQSEPDTRDYSYIGYNMVTNSPYDLGETYVSDIYQSGGWEAVDERYTETPPYTSSDALFKRTGSERQSEWVQISDISSDLWSPYESNGMNGRNGIGHVGMSSMLYHIQEVHGVDTGAELAVTAGTNQYNYTTPLSDQLKYDSIIPYRQANGDSGFAWKLVWESESSADRFTDIYAETLVATGGQEYSQELEEYQFPEDDVSEHMLYRGGSEFQGVYSISRNQNMVVIASAPSEEQLAELRPPSQEPLILTEYSTVELEEPEFTLDSSDNTDEDVVSESSNQGGLRSVLTSIFFIISFLVLGWYFIFVEQ